MSSTRVSTVSVGMTVVAGRREGSERGVPMCCGSPVGGTDLSHLEGTITGPDGTPYEGGVFKIDIVIPSSYPFEPPKMKFVTKIWHPNISSNTGAICLVSRLQL